VGAGLTLNVGQIEGGTALNIVPDLAIARFNIRLPASSGTSDAIGTPDAHPGNIQDHLHRLISSFNRDGISAELHGGITSPPKLMDEPTTLLMDHLRKCGADLGLTLNFHPTGGACDGNRLAAAGLPCLDSLGPRGGDIHSPSEFVHLDSLTERAKLTALFLMKLAAGEIPWPTERR
jgi:glutamate carboxypeptidase